MRGKKAKALRRAVRQLVPSNMAQKVHMINTKTGQIRLGACFDDIYSRMKKCEEKGVPLSEITAGMLVSKGIPLVEKQPEQVTPPMAVEAVL